MQVEDIKEYSTKIKRTEEEIAKGIIGQRNVTITFCWQYWQTAMCY